MEEELNIFKKSSLAFAAIASVLTFAPDLSFVSNQAKAEFPTKPIKVYVGFKPGGRTDMLARLISKHITEKKLLSQPIVIVNKLIITANPFGNAADPKGSYSGSGNSREK